MSFTYIYYDGSLLALELGGNEGGAEGVQGRKNPIHFLKASFPPLLWIAVLVFSENT